MELFDSKEFHMDFKDTISPKIIYVGYSIVPYDFPKNFFALHFYRIFYPHKPWAIVPLFFLVSAKHS
jgi:hypothetical protein